jgi:DNA-binding beta-propeller fold protein YncE
MRGRLNTLLKKIIASIVLILVILGATFTASAASETYIKVDVPGDLQEQRLSKEMYYAVEEINAATFGLKEGFVGITDLFYTESSDILLLCGAEASKLYRISKTYDKVTEVKVVDKKGAAIDFEGAEGVYADYKGNIYISDTQNSRILMLDKNGKLITTINPPVSELLPDDFYFQPTSVARDQHDYLYVLSKGCYYGALTFDPEYNFMGFYGPNTVESNALDALAFLWDRITSTEEKHNYEVKELPYSFSDFSFDSDGYMVTCTSAVNASKYSKDAEYGQIKKITHNGSNILYKRALNGETFPSAEVNFLETSFVYGAAGQSINSIVTDDNGYIYALEVGHGKIYVYDSECNLMSSFGGGIEEGDQLGIFDSPVAIALNNDDILVADKDSASITVFEPTEYGKLIKEAQALYLKGDYDDSGKLWEQILAENRNCQLAYRGLAMVYYNQGKLHESLEMAEIACDYSVYDLAWNKIISQFIAEHFTIIVAILAVIVVAVFFLVRYLRKNNKKLINNPELKLLFNAPVHPFNTFDDLKYKKMGSWKIAIVLTILFYVASVLNVTSTGFLFSKTLLRNYNSLYTLAATVGLIVLWSICNFLVCSMFEGKGTLKEVFISTTYCLMPWIVFLFLKVILTNFLPLSTAGLVTGIETVILIFTFFMLSIAMVKIHEFDFFKFLLTSIVVLFFMILVVFVILMCGILAEQFISFIAEIYDEIVHR